VVKCREKKQNYKLHFLLHEIIQTQEDLYIVQFVLPLSVGLLQQRVQLNAQRNFVGDNEISTARMRAHAQLSSS